ncbi:MAG: helix-turn-helix transcriptional regulator, partial [Betaproteobacteria bacterium]
VLDASVEYAAGRLCFVKLLNVERTLESAANLLAHCVTPLLADIWKQIDGHAHNSKARRLQDTSRTSATFSTTEREILPWLREGKTNWEIGQILGKSENTVKNQIAKMLSKSGARSRHELAKLE